MERNSCIETYRIIATIAVLIFHFNGWLVGGLPKYFDVDHVSAFRISQAVIESFSCICVNMFIVISGYFGLRLKWQSILRMCFLLLSIHVPFYFISCFFLDTPFEFKVFLRKFLIISNGGYFIQCYLMLMLLSPVINAFIDNKDKKVGVSFTFVLVMVEFWFDCITHTDYMGFHYGYSVMHFIVVYMVARYIFVCRDYLLAFKRLYWICAYFLCTIIILAMYIGGVNYVWQYSNPLIIISAVCSFIPFIYKSYTNKWINWVAQSTLAVYIIHVTVPFYYLVERYDNYILSNYDYPLYLLCAVLGVIFVFIFSILYDKMRLILTNPIYTLIVKSVENYKHEKDYS